MNPPSPREEIELRITAMLMGEMPPDEAAALQAQIAGDAELTALHVRLRRAMDLLREASAIPEQPAPPVPARLSDERRARLFAHFKGETKPGPVIVKTRREWKWAVPLGLAASLMALIGGAMYVNGFALRRASRSEDATLRLSESAESAVTSQIREATTVKNGTWASQPGMIRSYRSDKGERDSKEANRSYHLLSSVDELRFESEATHKLQTTDGGRRAGDGRAKLATSDPGLYAGSYRDTPRVETHFDRSTTAPPTASRGGLASSQSATNEVQGDAGKASKGGAVGTGALYLPQGVAALSASNFDAGIGALPDGAFAGKADTGNVAQAGGGGASDGDKLNVSAGGVISDPTSAIHATREALDQTNPVAFSSLASAKGEPVANRESQVAQRGWAETNRPVDAPPPSAVALAGVNGAALDFSKSTAPAEPAYPTPLETSAPVAVAAAESAPQTRAADEMKRKATVDVSGLPRDGTGLPALADVAAKEGTLDLNGKSQVVGNLSGATAGGLSKSGAGTIVLSDSNTYAGGTTITGGTLRLNGGIAGVAGPQPTTAPMPTEPPSAGKPEADRRLARANTAGDSQVALGLARRELSVADPKPGAKMDSSTDGLAKDSRDKPDDYNIDLRLVPETADFETRAPQKGIKRDAENGRGEVAQAIRGTTITNGIETAARREFGEKQADGPTAFPMTPATPMVTALGDKPILSPDVVEFEGFVNQLGRNQQPAAGQPASGPATASTRYLNVNKSGAVGQPGSPSDASVGRIAFWADDDSSKVNVNTAGGKIDPAQAASAHKSLADLKQPADFAEGRTHFGTFSGVVTTDSTGVVALNKNGGGNWSLSGANTFTGGTTVNAGTLNVNNGTFTANGGTSMTVTGTGGSTLKTLTFGGTGSTAERGISTNEESDIGKTPALKGTADVTFAGVVTKSGQRAGVEVKRELGYDKEFAAPEIPRSLADEGRGTATKLDEGKLTFGGTIASAAKAPVATPAPRGGDVDSNADLFFDKITPPHRADGGQTIELTGGTKFSFETRPSDSEVRKADDALNSVNSFRATAQNLKEGAKAHERSAGAQTDVAGPSDQAPMDTRLSSSLGRTKARAGEGKGDAQKSGAAETPGFVQNNAAVVILNDDVPPATRISNPRGGTVEGEVEKKPADFAKKEFEELGLDRLAEKSKVTLSADVPLTGRLFRAQPPSAKPDAPAEAVAPAKEKEEDEVVALRHREKREKSGESKGAVVALGTGTSSLEKLEKAASPEPLKQVEAKLKVASEIAEQLQEKRVEELKSAQEKIEAVAEREPEAPKPAPNPLVPQPEIRTGENAFSTFSLNVSDVAFKLAGASLERGTMPDVSTLRTEEFINAFDYRDPEAAPGAPLAFASERARYPFAQNRDVVRFSVKTAAAGRQPGKPLNVVLLLDNSGSMERADRVRILQEGLRTLSVQLQPQDKLSVVTFARTPRLWADGVAGDKAAEVTARVGEITPEGGTNLAAALDLGYATALKHYQPGSINHVVLLTDGAANLGNVDPAALKQKVEAHRKQGIALDCFGIGWEGLNDDMLEQLSRNGDGRYGFINTPEEAATNFAGQLAGALRVAASDVKVQVEWNPKRVTSYRQVGYAKHQLTKEQFRDNTVDAAELAAAESGNALYVVEVNPQGQGDLATVRVRFKVPGTSDYREHEWTVPFTRAAAPLENSSSTLRLAASAAAFSEMLAGSPFATEVTSDRLLGLLSGVPAIYGADARPKRLEWMIRQAKSLSGR